MTEHKPAGWQEAVPEISVIVPVYNVGEYLDICMESIVGQGLKLMQILSKRHWIKWRLFLEGKV